MICFIEEFEKLIIDYEIERKDICLVGSSVLTEKGFRTNHDFDFAVTSEAREKLVKRYGNQICILPTGTICFNENIQILQDRYMELGIDDSLLFTNEYSIMHIKGFRIAKIEIEIAKKIIRFAAKDEIDLQEIGNSENLELNEWKQILKLVCGKKNSNSAPTINKQAKSFIKSILKQGKRKIVNLFKHNEKKLFVNFQGKGAFCAILWGTVAQYFDEIEKEIARHFRVIKSETVDYIDNMERFVFDIYSIDDIDKWKIKLKQAYLTETIPSIRVILFEIKKPNFRINERNGMLLTDEGAKMKNKIRTKYKKRLNRYFYDVIIHTSDNYDISLKMIEVIKRYGGLSDV